MFESLLEKYRPTLADGKIAPDSAQALGVEKLQILTNRLINYTPPARTDFFSFFTRRRGEVPKGLYIFGAVGRGKTMLMDLFSSTVAVKQKRRAHFHEFMADVHARLAAARREAKEDPIVAVAKSVAAEARLLCLDELFVIDIADATILQPAIRHAVPGRHNRRRNLEQPSARPLQGRPQPRSVPALHRSHRREHGASPTRSRPRFQARPDRRAPALFFSAWAFGDRRDRRSLAQANLRRAVPRGSADRARP